MSGPTFGTEGADWHWQDGETIEITQNQTKLALHDLTGFEGRCDAIVFSNDAGFIPSDKTEELAKFRRQITKLPEKPDEAGQYELVVVGGGMSGICTAVTAARLGMKVAMIQDRSVLGGNNSSEVRVHLGGKTNFQPYPAIGDVVKEIGNLGRGIAQDASNYEDDKKLQAVQNEKNISLFLEMYAMKVESEGKKIKAIIAEHIRTGRRLRFAAPLFADCTSDGTIGFLAGADFDITSKGHMGPSNPWRVADTGKASAFPRCPWALDLSDKPFPGRGNNTVGKERKELNALGDWFWESGFYRNAFKEAEYIRDWNFRAMYGAWDCLKNTDKVYPNYKLIWAAYTAGKRESRRLLGDVVLSQEDITSGKQYPDGCVPLSWPIDLHLPSEPYRSGFENNEFIAKTYGAIYEVPYWLPYRCLYSRNIENLFMAGRDISVTHEALGAVRVMRTCGMMGEVAGMAASLCKKHNTNPRGVYEKYLDELKGLMKKGVGKPSLQGMSSTKP